MKKILMFMGILMIGLTLSGCNGSTTSTTPPTFSSVMIEGTNPFNGTEFETYYKGKREDLAVRVELVNPSNFTINSIVINNINYRFTRFTDDSTNSLIFFDISTGVTLQGTEYSINEIIYQDGNNTKSVLLEDSNANTWQVYVYRDTPTVERENHLITKDSISIDFNTIDTDGIIEANSLIAELYLGETRVATKNLDTGQDSVEFTGLLAHSNYEVKVVSDYDLDDSNGMNTGVTMFSEPFSTLLNSTPTAVIDNLLITSNSITFDVDYSDNDLVTSTGGISVAVYDGETLVRQAQINGSEENLGFVDLLNDTEYTLKVLSDYNLRDGHGVFVDQELATQVFLTLPRIVPEPMIENLNVEENRVLFDLIIDDPDTLIDKDTLVAKLYIDDILMETAEVNEYNVDFGLYNLFSNYEFVIEIEATYNLNDGNGDQPDKIIFSETFTTLNNAVPSVVVDDVVISQGYVTIDLESFDINNTLKSALTLNLYENESIVASMQFGVEDVELVLSYLVKNSENYSIEIVADYNLRDGYGTIENHLLFRSVRLSLEPKAPAAELNNIVSTNDSISLDINFMDIDETVAPGTMRVYLYLGDTEIDMQLLDKGINNIIFNNVTGLLSNNLYTIEVVADYNLDDGADLQVDQILISGDILTLEKVIPTAEISNDLQDTTSIMFDIEVLDPDLVIDTDTLKAILYLNGVATGAEEDLDRGENFGITFDGILSDTAYNVVIVADYDLYDGNGTVVGFELNELDIRTAAKNRPDGTILNLISDKESISFDVNITDDDSVIIDELTLKAVLFLDGVATGDEEDIDVGVNSVTFNGIQSDTRYSVRVITDYYLNDASPVITEYLLDYSFVSTVPKEIITATIDNVVLGKTVITFDVDVLDDDLVHTILLQAVLYKDDVATGDTLPLDVGPNPGESFTGLLADSSYVVKIESNYDLNDGDPEVVASILATHTAITEPLEEPSATITITNVYDTEIEYEVLLVDPDSTLTLNLKAVLYKDGVATGDEEELFLGASPVLSFDGLDFGSEYVIKVEVDYNMNSGGSDIEGAVLTQETVTTHQIIVLDAIIEDKKYISFTVMTEDTYGIISDDSLEMQLFDLDGLPVGDSVTINLESGVALIQLYSDNLYSVEFSATYDLGAGDVTEVVYTHEFNSLPLDEPIIYVYRDETIVVTGTTIDIDVEIGTDPDSVIEIEVGGEAYVDVNLYANGDYTTVIGTFQYDLLVDGGTQTVSFAGLDTVTNSYQILIEASIDFNTNGDGYVYQILDEITFIEAN